MVKARTDLRHLRMRPLRQAAHLPRLIHELSLLRIAERKGPGRPLSARSVWAIVATAEGDHEAFAELARARAKSRLQNLLALVSERRGRWLANLTEFTDT